MRARHCSALDYFVDASGSLSLLQSCIDLCRLECNLRRTSLIRSGSTKTARPHDHLQDLSRSHNFTRTRHRERTSLRYQQACGFIYPFIRGTDQSEITRRPLPCYITFTADLSGRCSLAQTFSGSQDGTPGQSYLQCLCVRYHSH
jgi:hypothetical protein